MGSGTWHTLGDTANPKPTSKAKAANEVQEEMVCIFRAYHLPVAFELTEPRKWFGQDVVGPAVGRRGKLHVMSGIFQLHIQIVSLGDEGGERMRLESCMMTVSGYNPLAEAKQG